jgi:NAD(P)-dependent dehydrogenase (short-subunit alcohol dehydrogenase family)
VARVFITGSSDGLALMAARVLIEHGNEVVVHGRNDGRSRYALEAAAGARAAGMTETIARAIRVEKVGVRRLAKKARLGDRTVTAVVNGGDAVSGEDLVKLHRAAEDLIASKRTEDERVADLLQWARVRRNGARDAHGFCLTLRWREMDSNFRFRARCAIAI